MPPEVTETPANTPESGGQNPGSGTGQGTPPANGGEKAFTQEDVNRIVSERLAEERRKSDEKAKKEREKDESAREAQRLTEEGKHKELAEKERAAREKAERERDEERAATKARVIKTEIRSVAREMRFADPDDAFKFIDFEKVTLNDDLEPTNVKALLEELVKAKAYLVKSESDGSTAIPRTPNGEGIETRRQLVEHEYERQKRSGRYTAF